MGFSQSSINAQQCENQITGSSYLVFALLCINGRLGKSHVPTPSWNGDPGGCDMLPCPTTRSLPPREVLGVPQRTLYPRTLAWTDPTNLQETERTMRQGALVQTRACSADHVFFECYHTFPEIREVKAEVKVLWQMGSGLVVTKNEC